MSLYNAQRLLSKRREEGLIKCPYCEYKGMHEDALSLHFKAYHKKGPPTSLGRRTHNGYGAADAIREFTARERNKLLGGMGWGVDVPSECLGLPHNVLFLGPQDTPIIPTDPLTPARDPGYWSRSTGHTQTPPTLTTPTSPHVMTSHNREDYQTWRDALRQHSYELPKTLVGKEWSGNAPAKSPKPTEEFELPPGPILV